MNLKTGVSRKQSTPTFPKNEHFLPPDRQCTCARQRLRNVCFSGNLACFVFLKDPFWDSPFWLITDDTGIKYQGSLIENLVKKKNSLKHLYFCVVFYLAIEVPKQFFIVAFIEIYFQKLRGDLSQQIFTCSKLTVKTVEKSVKYDQS